MSMRSSNQQWTFHWRSWSMKKCRFAILPMSTRQHLYFRMLRSHGWTQRSSMRLFQAQIHHSYRTVKSRHSCKILNVSYDTARANVSSDPISRMSHWRRDKRFCRENATRRMYAKAQQRQSSRARCKSNKSVLRRQSTRRHRPRTSVTAHRRRRLTVALCHQRRRQLVPKDNREATKSRRPPRLYLHQWYQILNKTLFHPTHRQV